MTANQFTDFNSPEWKEGVTFDRAAEILFPELCAEVKATYVPLLVIGDSQLEAMRKRASKAAKKIFQGLNTILNSGQLELRQLHPPDDPQAKWTPLSWDVWKAKGLGHYWHPFELVSQQPPENRVEIRLFRPDPSKVDTKTTRGDTDRNQKLGPKSKGSEMISAFHELYSSGKILRGNLNNKMGVWGKVFDHLGITDGERGYSYQTFLKHVGPEIEKTLKTRNSEN